MLPLGSREILSFTCFWATEFQIATAITGLLSENSGPKYTLRQTAVSAASTFPPEQFYNPKGLEVSLWLPVCQAPGAVFFPNLQDGGYSLVRHLVARLHFKAVSVRVSPLSIPYPICEFILHLDSSVTRVVRVMRDSARWDFFADGPAQAFEDPNAYRARLIKQRFTQPMLEDYMSSLGWRITLPEFWRPSHGSITKICS
jgi:hypothetical protein